MMQLTFTLCLLFISFPALEAYPWGAGGCSGGQAAVGLYHVAKTNIITGSLAQGGFTVTLDSQILSPDVPLNFVLGQPHTIQIISSTSKIFTGFLFRIAGGTSGLLFPQEAGGPAGAFGPWDLALAPLPGDSTAQYSNVCVDDAVGGVSHTSNVNKTTASANLTLAAEVVGLSLDITVVVLNRKADSTFYFSGFTLNSVPADKINATAAPIAPYTTAPVIPTKAPINTRPAKRPQANKFV